MAAAVAAGDLAVSAVTADKLASYLDAPDLPDPDLIIRTSGEQRLSNFLLWQAAYSELVFVPTYWPDFDRAALENAIIEYRRRERRFGGLIARTRSWSWQGAVIHCARSGLAAESLCCGYVRPWCWCRSRSAPHTSAAGRSRSFGASRRWACSGNGSRWWPGPTTEPC